MRIELPDTGIVILIGPSGSGKSFFAARHFAATEILSSDAFRGMVCDDPADQTASGDAFECLFTIAAKRLDRRKLVVLDATNLQKAQRKKIVSFAKDNNCLISAIALNMPENLCLKRNACRERNVPVKTIKRQCQDMKHTLNNLKNEGFRQVIILNSPEDLDNISIERVPLWTDLSKEKGPFDIIGDIHGCFTELCNLLLKLGYQLNADNDCAIPPQGRKAVFLGDLGDRGPSSMAAFRLVMNMVEQGFALCLPGNHEDKLLRYLEGKKVNVGSYLAQTVAELEQESAEFKNKLKQFLQSRISHHLLDDGKLVVTHAGLPEKMQGRASRAVREFCLYGDVTGERDEFDLPVRRDWAASYRGSALVAYAHSPQTETKFINNTICLDSGCVFGGSLSALRYPEREIVSTPALKVYTAPVRPLQKTSTDYVEVSDVLGRKHISTTLGPAVIIDEEFSLAALESAGRFCVDPRWLIYLPPTMSPCDSSPLPQYLEHPAQALDYYQKRGAANIMLQQKHMGSRLIAIVCNGAAGSERFGFKTPQKGIFYTRTGKPFFPAKENLQAELLANMAQSLAESGFWRDYATDWVCLDCEAMPWSFKADNLIKNQYAPFSVAGTIGLDIAQTYLENYTRNNTALSAEEMESITALKQRLNHRKENLDKYDKVWRNYCAPARSSADIGIAPFHILATEGKVWSDVPHPEHIKTINKYLGLLPQFRATKNLCLDLSDPDGNKKAEDFWRELTASGGEGMVVKPFAFIPYNDGKIIQPALKCRGREYLRIIYAPDYTDDLSRLKIRSINARRRRVIKEFALGLEGLTRFVNKEPLHRVYECAYGLLALESEPTDARL